MIKTRLVKLKILFLSLFLLTFAAHAQTTAFTYQGRLNDSTVPQPTNGAYDLLFKIFDVNGAQLGAPFQVSNVSVVNGIFTVQLDFGTVLISPATNLFLEIAVRPAGPQGSYTTLNPRQQITSAPFAVQALNAASAVDAQNLGGIAANQYVVTVDPRLSDARNPLPGSSEYIQNTNNPQSASFNVSGSGTVGGNLTGGTVNSLTQFNLNGTRILATGGTPSNLIAGLNAGQNLSSGFNNAFFGASAGKMNSTANGNAFFGSGAGTNSNADGNSFFGTRAGFANTSGAQNSFFGFQVGMSNTSGVLNSFFGEHAGYSNTTGANNAYFGAQTGSLATGNNNSFFGSWTGKNATSALNNTFVGAITGNTQTTEDNNTLIGAFADISAGVNSSTAIGAGAKATLSNTIVLGTAAERVVVPGLGVAGSTALCRNAQNQISTCSSSARYKWKIASFDSGLNIVRRLQPVTFNWRADDRADFGLVAEDVARIEPLLASYNEKGEVEGVKYDRVGVVLLNAVKEQQAQIERQNELIEKQNEQLLRQQTALDALKKLVCTKSPDAELCREKK